MGDSGDGTGRLSGDGVPLESVTGVAGPVLLAATVPDLARGDVLAGRYQIEAVIGTGGSGRVLRAFDRVTRSAVALKILRPEYAADPVWNERFSRELRVGRQIQHPNVCRVYDIGDADGHKFLSMELATGGTLRSQMEPGAMPRSVDDRIADARAVIQGVAALHTAGIVHRDLKPENILRTADGRLLVSDFGLATDPGAGPATTIMIGTPRYMAPEVVMGEPATARSDVWALGVVIHEILSGERPNRSLIKRRRRIYTPPEVGSPRERRLVELCARCSEEDPSARPPSAMELRREFEATISSRTLGGRRFKTQVAWAAVALAALASLGLVRNRWTSRAVASSSQGAGSASARALQPLGVPQDLSKGSTKLAILPGEVHCYLPGVGEGRATVIWGEPRKAEILDLASGQRSRSGLLSETFEAGCPQVSPDGRRLLFDRLVDGASQIFVSDSLTGEGAVTLVRGVAPHWLPNGQEFSFLLDARHAALFSVPTREMTVVTDIVREPYSVTEHAVDKDGKRLAVLYRTDSFGSLLIVHALPGLDVLTRTPVPDWSRHLGFSDDGEIQFTALGPDGTREMISAGSAARDLKRLAQVPGLDLQLVAKAANNPGSVVVASTRQFDLWTRDHRGTLQPLTTDGRSVNGARSPSGMLAIQRMLADTREVIVLRTPDGREEQLTDGASDAVTPAFSPDGKSLVYSKFTSGELVECSVESRHCVTILAEKLVPVHPQIDPSGQWIAYATALGAARVRVVSRTAGAAVRDLGPVQACAPVWLNPNSLWVVGSTSLSEKIWAEIDVNSGVRTGRSRSVPSSPGGAKCMAPIDLNGAASFNSVIPLVSDTSHIIARSSPIAAL